MLALVAVVMASALTVRASQASRSVWSGVYTDEQAVRGEQLYFDRCAECHGVELAGIERAPALVGAVFRDNWHDKPVRKLVERVEDMPPDEPSVVSLAEAVDATAYLLYASGMPAGSSALPDDRRQLGEITFLRAKP